MISYPKRYLLNIDRPSIAASKKKSSCDELFTILIGSSPVLSLKMDGIYEDNIKRMDIDDNRGAKLDNFVVSIKEDIISLKFLVNDQMEKMYFSVPENYKKFAIITNETYKKYIKYDLWKPKDEDLEIDNDIDIYTKLKRMKIMMIICTFMGLCLVILNHLEVI